MSDNVKASKPYRGATVYRSGVRVARGPGYTMTVYSHPIPLHAARVSPVGRDGLWTVEFFTVSPATKSVHIDMEKAIKAAGDIVSKTMGREWKTRFTGSQRYAMGQQKCPRIMSGGIVCDGPAKPGSVWCEWHPEGKGMKL